MESDLPEGESVPVEEKDDDNRDCVAMLERVGYVRDSERLNDGPELENEDVGEEDPL